MKHKKILFLLVAGFMLTFLILGLQSGSPASQSTDNGNVEVPAAQVIPFGGSVIAGPEKEVVGPVVVSPETILSEAETPAIEREVPIEYAIDIQELKAIKKQLEEDQSSSKGFSPFPNGLFPSLPDVVESLNPDSTQPLYPGIGYTGWYPPDPTMAAGPSNLVLAVNSSVGIYGKTGTIQLPLKTMSNWFLSVGTTGLSIFDPWVIYDQGSGRFFLSATGVNYSTQESYLFLSVSTTSDALGPWYYYRFNAKLIGGTVTSYWADYPKLGVDTNGLYITANMYNFSNQFQYAKLWVFNKSTLTAGGSATSYLFYNLTNINGTKAFAVQPSLTLDNPGVEYLINTFSSGGNGLTLWSLSCPTCNPPTLTRIQLSVPSYSIPPGAEQPGTTVRIDTGDNRLLNAAYKGGNLWTTHTTLSSSYSGLSAVRVYKITPANNTATLDKEFTDYGFYYFNASVMPSMTWTDRATVVFNRSSTFYSEFAGAWYRQRVSGVWSSPFLLKSGEATSIFIDSTGRNRWGDYAGNAPDPDGLTTWIYNQYAKTGGLWGTEFSGTRFLVGK